jgi:hypothetical protein
MTFWNIFNDFVTTNKVKTINKISEDTYVDQDGKVFVQNGNIISGSDGSIFNVVERIGSKNGSAPGMAIQTSKGFGDDDGML